MILFPTEYEIATEENFFRSGTLALNVNSTQMDVKFFVDRNGFHVLDLQGPKAPQRPQQQPTGVQRPFGPLFNLGRANVRPVPLNPQQQPNRPNVNQLQQLPIANRQARNQNERFLNPTFSRPDLLTGNRSIQPGR